MSIPSIERTSNRAFRQSFQCNKNKGGMPVEGVLSDNLILYIIFKVGIDKYEQMFYYRKREHPFWIRRRT